jgi:hypothetical protein
MRSLIFVSLLSAKIFAEPAQINYQVFSNQYTGITNIRQIDDGRRRSDLIQSVGLSSGLLKKSLRLRGNYSYNIIDLSNYRLINNRGEESLLGEGIEDTQAGLGGDILYKDFTFSLDGAQTTSASPLPRSSLRGQVLYQSYLWGFNLRYSLTEIKNERPASFVFIPETLRSKELVTQVARQIHQLEYEQILTWYLKSQVRLTSMEANEDRPLASGARLGLIAGITDELSVFAAYETISENKNQLPGDGSGAFSLEALEMGLVYEFFYDHRFRFLYTYIVEQEQARGPTPFQQIGGDVFSIGYESRLKKLQPFFLVSQETSNTGRNATQFSGGLRWEI